nr:DUF1328 domain-containing protein [Haloarchaeobius litoreus]
MHPLTTALPSLGDLTAVSSTFGSLPLQFGGGLLELAILFFILAIVAAVLGARGIAGMTMEIARILVLVFLVLAILSLLL